MPHPALDLLAAKAKLAGAVIVGMAVAGGMGGGALSLVADSSGTPDPVVVSASAEPTESPEAKETEAPEVPDAVEPSEAADASAAPAAPDAAAAPADVVKVVLNHATVVSVSPTSLVVTAAGTTTTWTLSPDTQWTGAIKDPAQVLPGMVIHLRGTKTGDAYTATHVVTPGNNKPKHVKAAKTHAEKTHTAKTHAAKTAKGHRGR